MNLHDLLVERYAVLHNLKDRSIILFDYSISRLSEFLGRPAQVSDLDDLTISRFVRWRATNQHRGRHPAPATVRKDLAHLVSLWNHAARKRMPGANGEPIEFPDLPRNLVRVPTRPPRGYTAEEVSRMVREARSRVRPIGPVPGAWMWESLILCAWYTGERIGALLRVRWSEVDLEDKKITFLGETRKGGIETIHRDIPESLCDLLKRHRRAPNDYVWPWLSHRKKQDTIYQSLRLLCKDALVVPRGFHAIRKASGSYVARGGGDATAHLSHADSKTTRKHYLDESITGRQSALDYLPPLDLADGPPRKPR
ncbi:MAG: hypothetical protein EBT03_12175 [Betaproteobacteria bacterium]|nr:hypothetical protein [Betaproteobacteria bacterium]NCA17941.1 hypothetical protein [Betaproteobacteria bacterium]NDF04555.1 hypothetical protein [Betaproteobacteria bacterium]